MAPPQALHVRADTDELVRVRRRVGRWAQGAGLSEAAARRLVLAVDETVANAIEHSLEPGARIVIGAEARPGRLTVAVRYRGPRFDPTTAPTPTRADTLRQRAAGGYGLHLIRSLADAAAYRWDGGTNEVRLTVEG